MQELLGFILWPMYAKGQTMIMNLLQASVREVLTNAEKNGILKNLNCESKREKSVSLTCSLVFNIVSTLNKHPSCYSSTVYMKQGNCTVESFRAKYFLRAYQSIKTSGSAALDSHLQPD